MTMKIIAGADHGGVALKDELVKRLEQSGYEVEDLGTHGLDSVHYPNYAVSVAKRVAEDPSLRGLLVCGTGIGISIAANKVPGIRCAKVNTAEEGALAAEHNHANIIAFGGRIMDVETAWDALRAWLETEWGGGRHAVRVGMIDELDK